MSRTAIICHAEFYVQVRNDGVYIMVSGKKTMTTGPRR